MAINDDDDFKDDDDRFDDEDNDRDDHDNSEDDAHKHIPPESKLAKQIRSFMTTDQDVVDALAYRFEYYVYHAGKSFRIGRVAHDDILGVLGEWCWKHARRIIEFPMQPVHVFMNGMLWKVLTFRSMSERQLVFHEVAVMFGLVDQAVEEEEGRVFVKQGTTVA